MIVLFIDGFLPSARIRYKFVYLLGLVVVFSMLLIDSRDDFLGVLLACE